MEVCRKIECAGYWDALVVGQIFEEHGIQVCRPDEVAPLTMQASGSITEIRAAVAQFVGEFPRAEPIVIEGEDADPNMGRGRPAGPRYHNEGMRAHEQPPLAASPPRCSASTAKGSQCKLPAVQGASVCAIHGRRKSA